nr:Ni/Fe hydrogenase subunit alpha [Gammaproteobacteria bacterium]
MERITIDPITRLEGHGKIEIFLDEEGNVANTYFQIPELRGFEQFCVGRPVEDVPIITNRICGVCPEAHNMAGSKAADAVYNVDPPRTAKMLRELLYSAFYVTDHATHFYALGGPDFVMGPDASVAERNILGVIHKVGLDVAGKVIQARKAGHTVIEIIGGRKVHPCTSIPGGLTRGINDEEQEQIEELGRFAVEFAQFSLQLFSDIVLGNQEYVDLILSDAYTIPMHYIGMVDQDNKVNFYDGKVSVVDPEGKRLGKYSPDEYTDWIAERVEPWTYLKFPYLKKVGWKGFVGGKDSGVYSATPLSRLNASDGMATPKAQEEYEKMFDTLGGKPVHQQLAAHWARLIELLYAAERWMELVTDPEITSDNFHTVPTEIPSEGVGIVEAPRGTLTHHYWTDERGVLTKMNLIVGTTNNYAPISMSIKKAAQNFIK